MQQDYQPKNIEAAAQQYWEEQQAFRADEKSDKPKYYCLSMFPYPSGKLHMGHVRNYTIGDVLSPLPPHEGLQRDAADGLGCLRPARRKCRDGEQRAACRLDLLQHRLHEAAVEVLGLGIDWSREVTTCKPDYYRWEQWLFTRLFEKGIIYKKTRHGELGSRWTTPCWPTNK